MKAMAPKLHCVRLAAICVLSATTLVNAQGYCRTLYQVKNCSMCETPSFSHFPDECRESKGLSNAVECLCTRPHFSLDGKPCEQAIQLIGFVRVFSLSWIVALFPPHYLFVFCGCLFELKLQKLSRSAVQTTVVNPTIHNGNTVRTLQSVVRGIHGQNQRFGLETKD